MQRFAQRRLVVGAPVGELQIAEDRRQRRAELVAQRRDQRVLERVRFLEPRVLALELAADLLQLSDRLRLGLARQRFLVAELLLRALAVALGCGIEQQHVERVAVGNQVQMRAAAVGKLDERHVLRLVERHADEEIAQHLHALPGIGCRRCRSSAASPRMSRRCQPASNVSSSGCTRCQNSSRR